jgi:hypothetical protein
MTGAGTRSTRERCRWRPRPVRCRILDPATRVADAFELVEGRYRLAARGTGDEALTARRVLIARRAPRRFSSTS